MRTAILCLVVLGLSFVIATAPPARAEPSSLPASAKPYMERGLSHYENKEFEKAIIEFQAGYDESRHPDFLYALAQAHRRAGDCRRAVPRYREFLATGPPEREATRARFNLRKCGEEAGGEGTAGQVGTGPEPGPELVPAPGKPAGDVPPDHPARPWYRDRPGNILVVTGGAVLAIGIIHLGLSERHDSRARRAASAEEFLAASERRDRARRVGGVATLLGTALVVGGVVRYLLLPDGAPAPQLGVAGDGTVTLGLEVPF